MLRLSLLFLVALNAQGQTTLYVDQATGNDSHTGLEAARPLNTLKAAGGKLQPGMTLFIVASKDPWREPLVVNKSGEADRRIIIEGNGNVLDLGMDVSEGPWKADGEQWVLERELEHPKNRAGLEQAAAFFVDSVPVYTQSPSRAGPLKAGQVRFDERGLAHVMFPEGKRPGNCRIIRPKNPMGTSGVSIQGSWVTVRNLTCQYAGNDGFNLHGNWKGIRLENVKALFNGDEGISAHDQCEVEVIGAEVAYNGSVAGGIADVNQSVTVYRNCLVYRNRAAFHFDAAGRHEVRDSVVFGNGRDLSAKPVENVTFENVISLPSGARPDPVKFPEKVRGLVERAVEVWGG